MPSLASCCLHLTPSLPWFCLTHPHLFPRLNLSPPSCLSQLQPHFPARGLDPLSGHRCLDGAPQAPQSQLLAGRAILIIHAQRHSLHTPASAPREPISCPSNPFASAIFSIRVHCPSARIGRLTARWGRSTKPSSLLFGLSSPVHSQIHLPPTASVGEEAVLAVTSKGFLDPLAPTQCGRRVSTAHFLGSRQTGLSIMATIPGAQAWCHLPLIHLNVTTLGSRC